MPKYTITSVTDKGTKESQYGLMQSWSLGLAEFDKGHVNLYEKAGLPRKIGDSLEGTIEEKPWLDKETGQPKLNEETGLPIVFFNFKKDHAAFGGKGGGADPASMLVAYSSQLTVALIGAGVLKDVAAIKETQTELAKHQIGLYKAVKGQINP